MADLSAVTKSAAIVLPPQNSPFQLPKQTAPTCNAALDRPWQLGSWTNTDLGPFDNDHLLAREISDLQWCKQAPTMLGDGKARPAFLAGQQQTDPVVACSTCDYGFNFGPNRDGHLQCIDAPVCAAADQAGEMCTMSLLTPHIVIPCSACIRSGCSEYSGMSSCI